MGDNKEKECWLMSNKGLGILDALENLNTLVEVESLEEVEVTETNLLVSHRQVKEEVELEEEYWVKAGSDERTLEAIRETFRTVHYYLEAFYQKMRKAEDGRHLIEGINAVMVLVGEAAQKLDQYGKIFKLRVSEFKEYKELQNFYRTKVIHEIFHDFAKTPIKTDKQAPSSVLDEVEEEAGVHLLNDLDVIKRDHLYELFYLKNEAGHDFFSTELARRIKLACDFGLFAQEYFGEDPLVQIVNWEDRSLHLLAKEILKTCHPEIDKFYTEAMRYKEVHLVTCVHNAVMALMLASNPRNLIRQFAVKGCHRYFHDFIYFLRESIHDRDYQRFEVYSPPESKPVFIHLMKLVGALTHALFTIGPNREEIKGALKALIDRSKTELNGHLSNQLAQSNHALFEAFKHHPSGPVFAALDLIRDEEQRIFDPLIQGNFPEVQAELTSGKSKIKIVRMGCPVSQHLINKAYVTEEFKCYLRGLFKRHLYFNFQDRTSWKEHARCEAIEKTARQAEFSEVFAVVTMAMDTDFYLQEGVYHDLNDAAQFISHFANHLGDESTGYSFPPRIKQDLFPTFIENLLAEIHRTFFGRSSTLSQENRINFISLAYVFIELKIIELLEPSYLTLGSKDGLDTSGNQTVRLLALLGIGTNETLDLEALNTLLFGPTVMNRQRVVHQEQFDRTISMIRLLESKKEYLKAFASLYKPGTLDYTIQIV